jgi:hypothetical protein
VLERIEIFNRSDWQMSLGTRAAFEGMLTQLKPELSIEIGTAQGGSLDRIAAHSAEVHALDLTGRLLVDCPANATFHEGDSRIVLPQLLSRLEADGRNVDFALVDAAHSAAGVRADLEALLSSPALGRTVILVHDSFNPEVRDGIRSLDWRAYPKVVGIELDFVPGRMVRNGSFAGQLWDGLALMVVDERPGRPGLPTVEIANIGFEAEPLEFHDAHETIRRASPLISSPAARLRREVERLRSSLRWRLSRALASLGGFRGRRRL